MAAPISFYLTNLAVYIHGGYECGAYYSIIILIVYGLGLSCIL